MKLPAPEVECRSYRAATATVLGSGVLYTLTIELIASGLFFPRVPREVVHLNLPLLLWPLGPFVLVALCILPIRSSLAGVVGLVGSSVLVASAVLIYFDGMFVHPDGQNGLLFVFLPLWQLLVAAIVVGLVWITAATARIRQHNSSKQTGEGDAANEQYGPSSRLPRPPTH